MPASLDHVTIVTDDFEASRSVYEPLLCSVGLHSTVEYSDPEAEEGDPGEVAAVGFGDPGSRPLLWLVAGPVSSTGGHVALLVRSRDSVRAAHVAAMEAGAEVVQPPREWEDAQLDYFGAQFADAAGNLIEVVYRQA
ncbi:MAG TPA: VOC family protein [Jatrophihabitans sp.]|nr:VOC family protein [Jatrophihabitans sp.]